MFAHNSFLDILSETGVAGSLANLAFAGSLAYLAFRMLFRTADRRLRLMLIAAMCGLFGMYGSNMTSPNAMWPIGAVGLWSILGYALGLVLQERLILKQSNLCKSLATTLPFTNPNPSIRYLKWCSIT